MNQRVAGAIEPMSGGQAQIQPEGIPRQAHSLNAEQPRIIHEQAKDGWMKVQMQVAVDVVQFQPSSAEFFELPMDFVAQLFAQFSAKEIAPTDVDRIVAKFSRGVYQARYPLRR